MPRVRTTRQAEIDLLNIWLYVARDDPAAADRLFDRLERRCAALARHPRLGPARSDIATQARCLVEGNYLVLYRIVAGGVEIVRVVHGARDLKRIR